MSAVVASTGECLLGEGLMWLIAAVACSLAAYRGSSCLLARAMDPWLLPINCYFDDCRARLVRFHSKTRYNKHLWL